MLRCMILRTSQVASLNHDRMPEFKRRWNGARQSGEEIFQQRRIGFQIRWQLKQDRTKLSRGRERFNGLQKARHEILRALQAA